MRWILLCGLGVLLLLAACGQTTRPTTSSGDGHEHGAGDGHEHGAGEGQAGAAFDAQFIDGMIEHHQGAVRMAEQARTSAEHAEIKQLAEQIIKAQQAEITQMQEWRKQWYADLAPTGGLAMDMGAMEISADTSKPFDQRFLEAMISHHQGALHMAEEAKAKAEHDEIKHLAEEIIKAQQAEITQMQEWQRAWFGSS